MLLHLFDIILVTRSFGTHIPDLTVQQSLLRQGDEDLPNGVQKRKRSQAVREFFISQDKYCSIKYHFKYSACSIT